MNKIYNGKHKWFDGDCLKYRKYGKENTIDWESSVGCTVEFQCKDYHGYYTIIRKYSKEDNTIKINKKSCGKYSLFEIFFNDDKENIFIVDRRILRSINFEYRLGIYSFDYLYDIGDVIKDKYLVLDRTRKIFYKKDKHPVRTYVLKCIKDNHIFEIPEYMIKKQDELCPLCSSNVLVSGINDIATLKPELIKFLVDKNDAYKYMANTNQKLNFVCDICGEKFKSSPRSFPISLPCGCYSAKSYPNRFIIELFKQLNIEFIEELRKCHFGWCGKYRYDLFFEYNDKKYIVEMDGGFHKKPEVKKIDNIKDKLANDNNVEVIRIDCDYKSHNKRFEYIKNNVINSKLSEIFNFENIDWISINVKILTNNDSKEVWKLKKLGFTNKQISNILNINVSTVSRYIKNGIEIGELKKSSKEDNIIFSKVMVVINLKTMEKNYYVCLRDFYENSLNYIGFKMSNSKFKNKLKDGHAILNGYDMTKITYSDYIKETIKI